MEPRRPDPAVAASQADHPAGSHHDWLLPVPVVVAPGATRLIEPLRRLLGSEAELALIGESSVAALVVVTGPDVEEVGAARERWPRAAVVATTDPASTEVTALELYGHGADVVSPSAPVEVVGAHVRALVRRAAWGLRPGR